MRNAWLVCLAVFLGGCKDKDVSVATIAKSPEQIQAANGRLRWTLPPGWREEAGKGMRLATLMAGPIGQAYEVSVTRLEGDAGGLLANVNRWRAQLRLPPLTEGELASAVSRVRSPAGEVALIDLHDASAKPNRIMAAVIKTEGSSWFFKMVGPMSELEPFAPQFKSLLRSLRHES